MSETGQSWGSGSFHASIPPGDKDHLAGWNAACWSSRGLDAAPDDARILSLMIHDRHDAAAFERFHQLEAVITRSDGFDHVPVAALRARGVDTYHLEGYATESVAQLAVAFLLMLARRVPEAQSITRARAWDRSQLVGEHLGAMQVGIIGTGRIGTATARALDALGVPTMGFDVDPDARVLGLNHHETALSMAELLANCDAVSLHVPLNAHTRHLIGREEFSAMKPGAYLVNTARGGLVDVDALTAALDGPLGGYAADVLDDEPAVPDLPRLAKRTDVVLTPHIGAHNQATIAKRYELTRRIAQAILDDEPDLVADYRVTMSERA